MREGGREGGRARVRQRGSEAVREGGREGGREVKCMPVLECRVFLTPLYSSQNSHEKLNSLTYKLLLVFPEGNGYHGYLPLPCQTSYWGGTHMDRQAHSTAGDTQGRRGREEQETHRDGEKGRDA